MPENQVIYLDNSTKSFLYDVDNVQNIYDNDMAKHYFKMTKEGLSCLDCSDDVFNIESDDESFHMKIDEEGVHINVKEDGEKKSEVKINSSGVIVRSKKDSL